MASTNTSVTISFDQKSMRLIERMTKALEEANRIEKEKRTPITFQTNRPCPHCGATTDHTHSSRCPDRGD